MKKTMIAALLALAASTAFAGGADFLAISATVQSTGGGTIAPTTAMRGGTATTRTAGPTKATAKSGAAIRAKGATARSQTTQPSELRACMTCV